MSDDSQLWGSFIEKAKERFNTIETRASDRLEQKAYGCIVDVSRDERERFCVVASVVADRRKYLPEDFGWKALHAWFHRWRSGYESL